MSTDPELSSAPDPAPTGPAVESFVIVHLYPHLLGTYGDAGNAQVLLQRARWRGIDARVVLVQPGDPVPRQGDVYLLGGGEDAKQTAAAHALRADGGLSAAVDDGAAVLGICAGYQLLGTSFPGVGGVITEGLGLLDVITGRMATRAVGDVLAQSDHGAGLGDLIGFENHGGSTTVGSRASALGRVLIGTGNGDGTGTEGAMQGNVYGTYLHGPALALNPALADRLLAVRAGHLAPLDDDLSDQLRHHRRSQVLPAAVRARQRARWSDRLLRRRDAVSGAAASLSN